MKKYIALAILFASSFSLRADTKDMEVKSEVAKSEEAKPEVVIDMDKVSETLGHLLVKQLNNPALAFNIDKIVDGMRAALAGKTAPLAEKEYEAQIMAIQEKIFQKTSEKNLNEATAFLEKNQKEQGVVCLGDKLQYKILKESSEKEAITNEMKPLVHYTGKLMDGTVFASSLESNNPIALSMKETIAGFSKGLLGMKKGEKRVIYIHPELAYGMASHLPPNSLLVFEVEVLETDTTVANSDDQAENATSAQMDPSEKAKMEEKPAEPVAKVEAPVAQATNTKGSHRGKRRS